MQRDIRKHDKLEVGGKLVGDCLLPDARTDRRTTIKHTGSGPIYWLAGGIKKAEAETVSLRDTWFSIRCRVAQQATQSAMLSNASALLEMLMQMISVGSAVHSSETLATHQLRQLAPH